MKRLVVVVGFILVASWFFVSPAQACDNCVYQGWECIGYVCWEK